MAPGLSDNVSGTSYDVAVVGAGIVGLAHAYTAAKLGKSVVVVERDARANGASIRNFGFITVTGQERHTVWPLAKRCRDIWAEIAPQAGIAIEHAGLLLNARYPESCSVLEAFMATEMGEGCRLLTAAQAHALHPDVCPPHTLAALWSPHELRVESRTALPKLAAWLEAAMGVTFRTTSAVTAVAPPRLETSTGTIHAETVIVCPGDDLVSLFPDRIAAYTATRCRLSMLRLGDPGFRLPGGVMSDLSLVRYEGYSKLGEAAALRQRLEASHARHLDHGVHLIVVQSADGTLVVGDSHHYDDTPGPFASSDSEALILDEFTAATGLAPPAVLERWTGTYASSSRQPFFIDAPSDATRLVMVTGGMGASTSFAIAEQTLAGLYAATTRTTQWATT